MRFGLLYEQGGKDGDAAAIVEQSVAADAQGFDCLWIADRPRHERTLGSPAIVLAALAVRTRAIRLGSFTLIAIGHPVRTAEDFAVIDLLSGGRLNFGVTVGSDREDFRTYGVCFAERDARRREALDIVLAAWSFDEFAYGGRYYQFPAHVTAGSGLARRRLGHGAYVPQWERGPELPDFLTVTPKPLQQPRPPVWVLAEATDCVTFAAEHGHSLVLPPADLQQLQRASAMYEAALCQARRARSEVEVALIVDLEVVHSRTSAEACAYLHQLHGATGANQVIWRVPYPEVSHQEVMAALRQVATEVQPMLQA
ncbi:MAG: LLM class flavin-dependent oxidoreductase [Candidatus Binatia bacterium]